MAQGVFKAPDNLIRAWLAGKGVGSTLNINEGMAAYLTSILGAYKAGSVNDLLFIFLQQQGYASRGSVGDMFNSYVCATMGNPNPSDAQMAFFASTSTGFTNGNDSFTKTLLHFDGANLGTVFTDSSSSAKTWTRGGAAVTSTTQKEFGTASGLFTAGSGDFITTISTPDFAFGTGDFTIDFWIFLNTNSGTPVLFDMRPVGTSGFYPTLYFNSGPLCFLTNAGTQITGTTPSNSVWHYISLIRASGSTKLYIDGAQVGSTYADSNTYVTSAAYLGSDSFGPGTNNFDGFVDEFRISKGVARSPAIPTGPWS